MGNHFDYLVEHYGYIGLIIALILGIIGLPIPDEILLTYVGYIVSQGKMSYFSTILCAFIGATAGISISYLLGSKLGSPFLEKFGPKLHLTEKRMNTTKRLFHTFGPYLLFIGYFIPGVRHITAYLAGINSLPYKRFALYAYSGALLWGFTFITLGKKLGDHWVEVEHYFAIYSVYLILFVIIIVIVGYLYWIKNESKQA
ncbi:DedA family protein [Halalkalibacter nanhaiisediminis]|uniref:Membrane protein DedA with SNARE-associated domain n=1 Tax=Halalkalibacter nanhaiisediminis TaxID=688079 RepID=A0A562QAA8_9BACI|nr:DedA family protein [Halalkalibacter nanhaiisediminis]TWI52956.1 membrane protein DedA with SNARE-associated domain [Halalkalibacter nanhaiisediminis]